MLLLTLVALVAQDPEAVLGNRRNTISSVAFHSAGKVLVYSGNGDGSALYNVETKEDYGALGRGYQRGTALSADGRFAASFLAGNASRAGMTVSSLTVWDFDLRQEQRVISYEGRSLFHTRVAISPDSQFVASAEYDEVASTGIKEGTPGGRLGVWTLAEGRQVHLLKGDFYALDFSPDSKLLAFSDRNRNAKILNLGTGKVVQSWTLPLGNVNGVKFSPDGQLLAAACVDHDVRLWYVKTGKPARTLSGHRLECTDAAFLADGKTLVTTGGDDTVRFWDVASGKERKSLTGLTKGGLCVAVHPGGTHVAVGCGDGLVRLFKMPELDPAKK